MPTVINGVRYVHHPNGGGLVSERAEVTASVFVGGHVIVHSGRIRGRVRLLDLVEIFGQPDISGEATIAGRTLVYGTPRITGKPVILGRSAILKNANIEGSPTIKSSRISDEGTVSGHVLLTLATVSDRARALEDARVTLAHLRDDVVVRGNAIVRGTPEGGDILLCGNLVIADQQHIFPLVGQRIFFP